MAVGKREGSDKFGEERGPLYLRARDATRIHHVKFVLRDSPQDASNRHVRTEEFVCFGRWNRAHETPLLRSGFKLQTTNTQGIRAL